MLWKFNAVFNPKRPLTDHARTSRHEMPIQPDAVAKVDRRSLYVHPPAGRRSRRIDDATAHFVDKTHKGGRAELAI